MGKGREMAENLAERRPNAAFSPAQSVVSVCDACPVAPTSGPGEMRLSRIEPRTGLRNKLMALHEGEGGLNPGSGPHSDRF